jgi:hypothetical protein
MTEEIISFLIAFDRFSTVLATFLPLALVVSAVDIQIFSFPHNTRILFNVSS